MGPRFDRAMAQTTQPFSSAVFEKFLGRLADRSAFAIPAYHVAVVLAHPGDVTICGATLTRLKGAQIVVVTNGVQRGTESAAYSVPVSSTPQIARWRELIAAADLAGYPPSAVTGLAVEDGKVANNVVALTRRLADILHRSGTAIAITHPCDGTQSDRSITGFAVHEAAALCRRKGQEIAILEMAVPPEHPDRLSHNAGLGLISLALSPQETALKQRMLACFAPSQEALTRGSLLAERFHVVRAYDFAEPASGGHIVYGDETSDLSAAHRQLSGDGALRQHGIPNEALVGASAP